MDLSVVVTTYNGEKYIREQIDSILNQTRVPDEVIVLDDGSTDETLDILTDYENNHPSIFDIKINDRNLGVTKNFEKGIRVSNGDGIFLCDQDDVWHPKKVERQISALLNNNGLLSFHDSLVVDKSLSPLNTHWNLVSYSDANRSAQSNFSQLIIRNFVKGSTILMDSSLREYILPIPNEWAYDWYVALIATLVSKLIPVNETLHKYRRHKNQESGQHPDSIFTALQRGIQSNTTAKQYQQNAASWKKLEEKLSQLSPSKLQIDKSFAQDIIFQRYQYERNRATIYDGRANLLRKLRTIVDNVSNGYYSTYGDVHPIFYVFKDGFSAFQTEFGAD